MMGDGDEDAVTGTEGEGAEGQDPAGGQVEAELPAELPEQEADDGEQEVAIDEPAKPSRGEARVQRLANETKAQKERADRLEAELNESRRASWQRQNEQTEQQQREMLALMTPDERASWQINQFKEQHQRERQQDRMQTVALLDKTAFDAKATINPVYARFKDVVEEKFQEQLRKGQPVEREILLQLELGRRALEGAGKSGGVRKQAAARVQSQKVSAGSGKGDASTERGKAGDGPAKRLEGVFI